MDIILYLFVATALLLATLATISIWAPRRFTVKASALILVVMLLPLTYLSFAALLSRPKPVSREWALSATKEATVIASTVQEGRGIYLWLKTANSPEPRAYKLPWNRDLAQQLQDAKREAEKNGGGLAMRMPFEKTWDNREPKFYAMPQPAMPPKDPPGGGPQVHMRPEGAA